jgi:hypothetical protein
MLNFWIILKKQGEKNEHFFPLKNPPYGNITWYPFMDHISGNKSLIGSIEVPFDREYPNEQPVKITNNLQVFKILKVDKLEHVVEATRDQLIVDRVESHRLHLILVLTHSGACANRVHLTGYRIPVDDHTVVAAAEYERRLAARVGHLQGRDALRVALDCA